MYQKKTKSIKFLNYKVSTFLKFIIKNQSKKKKENIRN